MSRNSSLSDVLHALLHLGHAEGPRTSEQLAASMRTNSVVIRRLLAGLREAGFVASDKGHGGGWRLARQLKTLSLGDVYRALGSPPLFAIGRRTEKPHCLVEKAVNAVLDDTFDEAAKLLLKRFDRVSLEALATDFSEKMRSHACASTTRS
jgi:DNA-binding IscR family transcriptional regulator